MSYENLKRYTVEEFQDNFDNLFEEVVNKQSSFVIVRDDGKEFIITPYEEVLASVLHPDKDTDHG